MVGGAIAVQCMQTHAVGESIPERSRFLHECNVLSPGEVAVRGRDDRLEWVISSASRNLTVLGTV
jgi:hypothetical protein